MCLQCYLKKSLQDEAMSVIHCLEYIPRIAWSEGSTTENKEMDQISDNITYYIKCVLLHLSVFDHWHKAGGQQIEVVNKCDYAYTIEFCWLFDGKDTDRSNHLSNISSVYRKCSSTSTKENVRVIYSIVLHCPGSSRCIDQTQRRYDMYSLTD